MGGERAMLQTLTCETVPVKHSRCSSLLGVPLSTQWGPQGYFYPIQIAQYGLSHYSKNLTEKPPHIEVYETAEEKDRGSRAAEWTVPKGCSLSTVPDKAKFTSVKHFVAPGGLWQADGWLAQLVAGGSPPFPLVLFVWSSFPSIGPHLRTSLSSVLFFFYCFLSIAAL